MDAPEELARLDRAIALDRLGGDEQLLQELASLFLDEYPSLIEQIRKAVDVGDARALERAAHSLKGSVGNFGAQRAHHCAYQLEMIGRQGNLAAAPEALARLEAEMEEVRPSLAEIAAS